MSWLERSSACCLLIKIAALSLAACGSDPREGIEPPDLGPLPAPVVTDASERSSLRDRYPQGPYGANEGAILENMRFDGYLDPSPERALHEGPFSIGVELQDFRRDRPQLKYLLLNVAAEWCAGCRVEAEAFVERSPGWRNRGGEIFSVLIEDRNLNPALPFHLERWSRLLLLNYPTVHDPEGFVERVLRPAVLPLNLIIEVDTMEILESHEGEDLGFLSTFDELLDG